MGDSNLDTGQVENVKDASGVLKDHHEVFHSSKSQKDKVEQVSNREQTSTKKQTENEPAQIKGGKRASAGSISDIGGKGKSKVPGRWSQEEHEKFVKGI